jgi:hypothetical protein
MVNGDEIIWQSQLVVNSLGEGHYNFSVTVSVTVY